jgi:hypothetical protein
MRTLVAIAGAASGGRRCVSKRGEKPRRDQPWNKMTQEEAERLRALLRDTKPADFNDDTARQRVGKVIGGAISRGPSKPVSRDRKRDRP